MNNTDFNILLNDIEKASYDLLRGKNRAYAPDEDRLHNFHAGADIMGGTTAQACWGYLTKHLVALRDKVERNDFSDLADLKEKCMDAINYIKFIWCIGNEEYREYSSAACSAADAGGGIGLTDAEREMYAEHAATFAIAGGSNDVKLCN